jgi:hypothetical protein
MNTDPTPSQSPSKEELEAEIVELRHSVGDTVDALSQKLDVKSRAKERVRSVPPAVPAGVAAVIALGVGIWLWRRRG